MSCDQSQVPNGFHLRSASVHPRSVFFDQAKPIRMGYRFEAPSRTDIRVEVVRAKGKRVVKSFRRKGVLPYSKHSQRWNALERDGDVADDGRYQFRVGAFGEDSYSGGSLKLRGYKFPIRGTHGYGGLAPALRRSTQRRPPPRGPGRLRRLRHEARGGAEAGAYRSATTTPSCCGNYIVLDTKGSSTDHLYVAHALTPLRSARVRAFTPASGRRGRPDRQRAHHPVPSPLRDLAERLAPRITDRPPAVAQALGRLLVSERATEEARSYGMAAGMLTVALATAGLLTYGFFALASHSLSADDYGLIVVMWSVVFIVVSVLFRPVEQLTSRTIAELETRGEHIGHAMRVAASIQAGVAVLFVIAAMALRDHDRGRAAGGQRVPLLRHGGLRRRLRRELPRPRVSSRASAGSASSRCS